LREFGKQLENMRGDAALREPLAATQRRQAHREIFHHRELRKNMPPLRHIADAGAGAAMCGGCGHISAIEGDLAARKLLYARDGVEQSAFAHAVAADERHGTATLDAHVDIPQHLALAIGRGYGFKV
jgi:hypothetical protein